MINEVLSYIKHKGKNFSFYEIKKDLGLTDGQLEIIKLQLLELGFIKEIKHHEGEDELNPIICRNCPESSSCIEKDGLSIKVYQLTQKAFEYKI
ncbi:hypothetical protein [Candidatus Hodarchaeum mangrovi]